MVTVSSTTVSLSGLDHPDLRKVVVQRVGDTAGLAISAGRLPKARQSIDPNEDAALVAVGPGGVFAAVMDGHLGFDAARETLAAAAAWAPVLVEAPIAHPARALGAVLADAQAQIASALALADDSRRSSRTAVSLALVCGKRLHVATIGDTLALLARPGRRRWVRYRSDDRFMGPRLMTAKVESTRWVSGDRLVLASDGLTDFLAAGAAADRLRALTGATPDQVAETLLEGALLGGAGDNVTVVCVDLG